MKYPNLRWILFCYNVRLEEIAAKLAMSVPSLSRRMTGLADFLPHERERIGEFLDVKTDFLFREPQLPHGTRPPRSAIFARLHWEGEDGAHISEHTTAV
jgi:hypothetical protein